jgi:hypothetical protein
MCARHRYHLRLRNKGYWVGSTYFCCWCHCSVEEIHVCLGECYFQQAYCILYKLFWLLHEKLSAKIAKAADNSRRYEWKGGRGVKSKLPPYRNGPISTCVRLACALRYFAGGLPYDIMEKYGVSEKSVRESIWRLLRP